MDFDVGRWMHDVGQGGAVAANFSNPRTVAALYVHLKFMMQTAIPGDVT